MIVLNQTLFRYTSVCTKPDKRERDEDGVTMLNHDAKSESDHENNKLNYSFVLINKDGSVSDREEDSNESSSMSSLVNYCDDRDSNESVESRNESDKVPRWIVK